MSTRLIGLGRAAFEHAAADPDNLADLIEVRRLSAYPVDSWSDEQWPEWEALGVVARETYGDEAGDDLDDGLEARGHSSRADPRSLARSGSSRKRRCWRSSCRGWGKRATDEGLIWETLDISR